MRMLNFFLLTGDDEYIYLGDRSTSRTFKGHLCKAVRRPDGKCLRGKNGNMLVSFDGNKVIVQARLLRKIKGQQ